MRSGGSMRVLHHVFAFSALLVMGGGCIAIYSFDEFETQAPITCTADIDCASNDKGKDDKACGLPTCLNGICTRTNLVDKGTLSRNHVIGDCQRRYCDGKGNEVKEVDPTNVRSDGIACTQDVCLNNKPENIVATAGTPCGVPGTEMTLQCDAMGVCRGCTAPTDCGIKGACADWACEEGACVKKLQPIGTEVANPVAGDCRKTICNLAGEPEESFAPTDAPDDNNPCTLDRCATEDEVKHDNAAGIKCGDCKVCDSAGLCGACNGTTSDCYQGECVAKPKTCQINGECLSNYCVDGYCCDSECSSKCMACVQAKTGVLSGICAPITNGTDPDSECGISTGDTCLNGNCSCSNGVKDSGEEGTDCGTTCGKSCTGTWKCGDLNGCGGSKASQTCCPWYGCGNSCPDQTSTCGNIDGGSCQLGATAQTFNIGTFSEWGCPFPASSACRSVTCVCQ